MSREPPSNFVLAAFRAECVRQLGAPDGVHVPRALRVYRAALAGAADPGWAADATPLAVGLRSATHPPLDPTDADAR